VEYDNESLLVEEPSANYGYTYADYLKWKIDERIELFRGRILKLSAPNLSHQNISGNLYFHIRSFLSDKKCKVFAAPFDVRLPVQNRKRDDEVTTVVQPDLCVICDLEKLDARGCCGAPDLCVEILSPGNSRKEVQLKFEIYEEAGVLEYWIVNPEEQNLLIYTLTNGKYIGSKPYAPGEVVTSTVLPGLQINLEDIFEN
jgi:Uma2 family endonuclease